MLGTDLVVTEGHCATARGLVRSIENERVLSVDFATIDITTRLLKVVRNGKSSQDSPSILFIDSNST